MKPCLSAYVRRGIRLFTAYHAFYVVLGIFQFFIWNEVYFVFKGSHSDFQEWFANYPLSLFIIVVGLKTLFWLALPALIFLFVYYRSRIVDRIAYNPGVCYTKSIGLEAGLLLVGLVFYLLLYFLADAFLEGSFFIEVQRIIAKGFLFQLVLQIICFTATHFEKIKDYLSNYLLTPSLPYNIAILRILFFSYLAYLYNLKYKTVLPTVSLDQKVPLPYIGWLIELIPVNEQLYTIFFAVGVICCLLIVIGWQTRLFLIVNAICCFYLIATPNFFGKLWHEQLVIWITWFLTFSRCYDVFSVDAFISNKKIDKSPDYTFPVRFIWLQLGLIYFWAGFYKLWDSGFEWALGNSMINQIQLEWVQHYDQIPSIRIDQFPVLLHLGGMAVILFEVSYLFFVLKPTLRWVPAIGGLTMHNIIGYLMYIQFFHHLQVFYLGYFDCNVLFSDRSKNAKRNRNSEQLTSKFALYFGLFILFMNGLCGMFGVNTYPFSAYPKYSALVDNRVKIIRFSCLGTGLNVHEIGEQNNFRWESYGWLEHNLIHDFENGEDVRQRVFDYWNIWVSHNPELNQCQTVMAEVVERDVAPRGRNNYTVLDTIAKWESR